MIAIAITPFRKKSQARSFSNLSRSIRWKSSERTASEVSRGSGRLGRTAVQGTCQSSESSRSARIAPVSTSILAAMLFSEMSLHYLSHSSGVVPLPGMDCADQAGRNCVQPSLLFIVGYVFLILRQPFSQRRMDDLRHLYLPAPGHPLQVSAHFLRHPQAVDLGLHALHCNTFVLHRRSAGSYAAACGVARSGAAGGCASAAPAPLVGRDFCTLCSTAAPMNAANSGCGSSGLDLNSGWNWQPRNHG